MAMVSFKRGYMTNEDIAKQLNTLSAQMRSVRIQVVLLGLKDSKQKHPKVIELENHLDQLLRQSPRNSYAIDECLEELETLITIKPEHHMIAQDSN